MGTSSLKFILGDKDLLHSRVRKTAEDHSPIKGRNSTKKQSFVYNRTHGFSVRTNRDRYQTPGELYRDEDFIDNEEDLNFKIFENQLEQEQSGPVKKLTPPRNTENK